MRRNQKYLLGYRPKNFFLYSKKWKKEEKPEKRAKLSVIPDMCPWGTLRGLMTPKSIWVIQLDLDKTPEPHFVQIGDFAWVTYGCPSQPLAVKYHIPLQKYILSLIIQINKSTSNLLPVYFHSKYVKMILKSQQPHTKYYYKVTNAYIIAHNKYQQPLTKHCF